LVALKGTATMSPVVFAQLNSEKTKNARKGPTVQVRNCTRLF